MRSKESRNLWLGLGFCSPWILGMLVFLGYPLGISLYHSFCDYSVLLPPVFIGLENYRELWTDDLFWLSLWNTGVYAFFAVLLGLFTSLTLALLLNSRVRGVGFYRALFFIPSLIPAVAGSVLWLYMYNGRSGIFNTLLAKVGVSGPAWLADPAFAKPAIILMAAWGAGHAMLIFLAGLQDVPESQLESALLDGAGFWRRLWHVTLPMISPTIYFNLIMGTIAGFQVFTQAFIMTGGEGAPERSTLFYVLRLYNLAYQDLRMGLASAMAWILFAIVLSLTLALNRFSSRVVNYER